ncbi:MAG: helix-turn-helix domain-containing protein [Oscillospiraceae bacterium]|nr:helix-turn-helix domain-containing protein [Oscillospiraceae bacterium]
MTVKIGDKIKALRRKLDVTQERLAEYLGITPQAVSRWESGGSYPDIEMLPALADFFGVTADELLCIDAGRRDARVNDYKQRGTQLINSGKFEDAIALFRQAVGEFPSSFALWEEFACALGCKNDCSEPNADELGEAVAICERIIADCTDDNLRYHALEMLCSMYSQHNEPEKVLEIAEKMPPMTYCRENLKAFYIGGEHNVLDYIESLVDTTIIMMRDAANGDWYTQGEKVAVTEKAIALIRLVLGEDCLFYHTRLADAYNKLSRLHAERGESGAALDALELAARHAELYDARPEADRYTTTVLMRRRVYTPDVFHEGDVSAREYLRRWTESRAFDILRDEPRFRAVTERLS